MAVSPEGTTLYSLAHKASGSKEAVLYFQDLRADLAAISGRTPKRRVPASGPTGDMAFANVIGDTQSELILWTVPVLHEDSRQSYAIQIFSSTGREILAKTFKGTTLSMTPLHTSDGPVIAVSQLKPKSEVVFYKADGLRELHRRSLGGRAWITGVDIFNDGLSELSARVSRSPRVLLLGENCWKPGDK